MKTRAEQIARYRKPHWADRPVLRYLLWFLVLPHQFGQWMLAQGHLGDR